MQYIMYNVIHYASINKLLTVLTVYWKIQVYLFRHKQNVIDCQGPLMYIQREQ